MAGMAVMLLLQSAASSQDLKKWKGKASSRVFDQPLVLFREIESAWKTGNARALSQFSASSKVYLSLKGMRNKGGYYSRSQVFYIFKNLFKNTRQVRFKFFQYQNLDKPDRRVYGIAYNNYKSVSSGRLIRDKVYVTLSREGKGWVVSEIKTTW
jgi:hypothetical protein